ncbi:hypothetical protein ACIQ1D_18625 [Lysinibacillus xylanilyticus]|uniref:hypothetical protein n=1 Tax=Lysinibacillus xylanilyticus TaxID=582475 RepID=UPI00382B9685
MTSQPIILDFKGNTQGKLYQNVIIFTENQINTIRELALQKKQVEWQKETTGEKFVLTKEQKESLLKFKNMFFQGIDAKDAILSGDINFKVHAKQRADERFGNVIELNTILSKQLQEEIVMYLIESESPGDNFEWKGFEHVSFTFAGVNISIEHQSIETVTIVVTLEDDVTNIITAFKKLNYQK